MLALFVALALSLGEVAPPPAATPQAVEVERVLATVRGVPILASDAELAEIAGLVPRQPGETDEAYRSAVVDALIALELRWGDLEAASIAARVDVDLQRAWIAVVERAGGEQQLAARLAAAGLPEAVLRQLVRRAAVVEAYVAARFAPFARPSRAEVEALYAQELLPRLQAAGQPAVDLETVREQIEAVLRERKLAAEVDRWTADLAGRAQVIRYR